MALEAQQPGLGWESAGIGIPGLLGAERCGQERCGHACRRAGGPGGPGGKGQPVFREVRGLNRLNPWGAQGLEQMQGMQGRYRGALEGSLPA